MGPGKWPKNQYLLTQMLVSVHWSESVSVRRPEKYAENADGKQGVYIIVRNVFHLGPLCFAIAPRPRPGRLVASTERVRKLGYGAGKCGYVCDPRT